MCPLQTLRSQMGFFREWRAPHFRDTLVFIYGDRSNAMDSNITSLTFLRAAEVEIDYDRRLNEAFRGPNKGAVQ